MNIVYRRTISIQLFSLNSRDECPLRITKSNTLENQKISLNAHLGISTTNEVSNNQSSPQSCQFGIQTLPFVVQ